MSKLYLHIFQHLFVFKLSDRCEGGPNLAHCNIVTGAFGRFRTLFHGSLIFSSFGKKCIFKLSGLYHMTIIFFIRKFSRNKVQTYPLWHIFNFDLKWQKFETHRGRFMIYHTSKFWEIIWKFENKIFLGRNFNTAFPILQDWTSSSSKFTGSCFVFMQTASL